MMNICVAGSRVFNNYSDLAVELDTLIAQYGKTNVTIIEGGAKGTDSLARYYAIKNNVAYREYVANWDQFSKRAGMLRNQEMEKVSDYLLAFQVDMSTGTDNMISLMKNAGKHGKVIQYNGADRNKTSYIF